MDIMLKITFLSIFSKQKTIDRTECKLQIATSAPVCFDLATIKNDPLVRMEALRR